MIAATDSPVTQIEADELRANGIREMKLREGDHPQNRKNLAAEQKLVPFRNRWQFGFFSIPQCSILCFLEFNQKKT